MSKLLCLFLLPIALAAGNTSSDSGAISSSSAAYDGNALILKGQVALEHGLGKMCAEEAILQKQESGKEFPFSTIELKNGIQIDLQDQTQLHCASAHLDFTALQGHLRASEKQKVIYTDLLKRGGNKKSSLRLMSNAVEPSFEKIARDNQKSDFLVHDITATGDVVADYAQTFTLHAGKAFYQKQGENTLRAYPEAPSLTCTVQRGEDIIHSDAIEIDINRHVLFLKNAQGTFYSCGFSNQEGEVQFKSEQLVWDHPQNTLHLQNHAHIEESIFGTLDVEKELILVQKESSGKKIITSLQALGKTSLQFKDTNRGNIHRFLCHGQVTLDRDKKQATFESPLTDGNVDKEQQLYYEEGEIAVYADQGVIDYALQDKRLQPSSIALKGNVRILSCQKEQAPRFGLADRVTYSPVTRTFILGAHPGGRVLFWGEKENLHISAQEIHLTQDGNRQTESVRGVGNVQFSFTADEEALLQKIFGLTSKK